MKSLLDRILLGRTSKSGLFKAEPKVAYFKENKIIHRNSLS